MIPKKFCRAFVYNCTFEFMVLRRITVYMLLLLLLRPAAAGAQAGDSIAFERRLAALPLLRQAALLDSAATRNTGVNLPKALAYVNREIELFRTITDKTWEGRPYCLKARIFRKLGDPDAAAQLLETGGSLYRNSRNDTGLLDYYVNRGNLAIVKSDYPAGQSDYNEALRLAEKLNDRPAQAMVYANIGNVYYYQQEWDKTILYYEKAKDFYNAAGDKGAYALTIDNIALVYDQQKKFPEAVSYHKAALEQLLKGGDLTQIAEAYSSLGVHYVDRGMNDSGSYYLLKSIETAKAANYESGRIIAMFNLGDLRSTEKNYAEAEQYLRESLALSLKSRMTSFSLEAANSLSELFEATGRTDSALRYSRIFSGLQDTLFNENNSRQLNNFRTRFELERSEKEVEVANKDREKSQLLFYMALAGSGLLFVLVLLVFRSARMRKKTNQLLAASNKEISARNKDITDSINYARRIQSAVLPDEKILTASVRDAFIFNNPRDIVSGDFYWFARKGSYLYVAVADCTGHGVPGALVSVVGINALQQLIALPETPDTSVLLGKLHQQVIMAMNKDVNLRETQDGMDIALVRIDFEKQAVQFSGAGRPLYYRTPSKPGIQTIAGDRSSIAGAKAFDDTAPYSQVEFPLEAGTTFYLFTDGIVDQFGGEKGKKFLTRRMIETLESTGSLPLQEQAAAIEKTLAEWQGNQEQTDDMLLIGFTC